MSSKDVIIADIIRVIQKDQQEYPTRHSYTYYFQGIKSLHGINCHIELNFTFKLFIDKPNSCKVIFKMTHPDMDNYDKEVDHLYGKIIGNYPNFDEENVSLALDDIKQLLSTLQFNILQGNFNPLNSTQSAVRDFFGDVEGLQFSGNECCVCMEVFVNTKTECDHYLCIPCYQQIRLVPDEEYDDCGNNENVNVSSQCIGANQANCPENG
jgi:Holliday junction resolvase RusA-like endonuclease